MAISGSTLSLLAGIDIRGAEIARVRQQIFGLAQRRRQGPDLVQHRLDLLLVVGRLNHIDRHHQQAARRHRRLRIVALLEAAARNRHDARVFRKHIGSLVSQR
jgi:hypothetical protein